MHASIQTIYAFATAPGKSGVAVLRLSGSQALPIFQQLTGNNHPTPARTALLRRLHHPDTGEMIDQALCFYFPNPNSFTGEDVVEIHLHGSVAVQRSMLAILGNQPGARLAEPGEFAKRAFLNGKMDLTESEGLADLIEAETSTQLRQATRQMTGSARQIFERLRQQTLKPLALLEAYIDFPDEEIPKETIQQIDAAIHRLRRDIDALLQDGHIGERIRNGLDIILIGAPNAGKSSLLNYLAGREAAIVHETPGTTRDMVEVSMDIAGYPVTLIDTAGLREAEHAVEQEGIRRAKTRAESADLILYLQDITNPEIQRETKIEKPENSWVVFTKKDLCKTPPLADHALCVSTKTGENMAQFTQILTQKIADKMHQHVAPTITRARHRQHLEAASKALSQFDMQLPLEIACEELRYAASQIGNITGTIRTDDILDVIFKEFCIGK